MNRAQVGSEGFRGFGGVRRGSDPNPPLCHLCGWTGYGGVDLGLIREVKTTCDVPHIRASPEANDSSGRSSRLACVR